MHKYSIIGGKKAKIERKIYIFKKCGLDIHAFFLKI